MTRYPNNEQPGDQHIDRQPDIYEPTYFQVLQAKAEYLAKAARECDELGVREAMRDLDFFSAEHVNRWTNFNATFPERS